MEAVFLGVIAVATVVMASVQVGIIVYGARLTRRVDRMVDVVELELKPALDRVNAMGGDMNRATSLAVAQVERVDQLFARVAERVDRLTVVTQDAVIEPFRQGSALLEGLRVAMSVLRGAPRSSTGPAVDGMRLVTDDEEVMFIG
jgi:hypothetical protein